MAKNDFAFRLSDFDADSYCIDGFMNNPWIGYPEVVVREGVGRFYNKCVDQGFPSGETVEVHGGAATLDN